MGTPLLAVASLAVDVLVRAIAGNDGVKGFGAVFALEALAMPHLQQNINTFLRKVERLRQILDQSIELFCAKNKDNFYGSQKIKIICKMPKKYKNHTK